MTGHTLRFPVRARHGVLVEWAAWSPDSRRVVVGLSNPAASSSDGALPSRLLDLRTREPASLRSKAPLSWPVTWRPASPKAVGGPASSSIASALMLVDPVSGKRVGAVRLPETDAQVPVWSRDGRRLAIGTCSVLCPVDVLAVAPRHGTARVVARVGERGSFVQPVAWSDDHHLVVRRGDRLVVVDARNPVRGTTYAGPDVLPQSVASAVFRRPPAGAVQPHALPWFWILTGGGGLGLVIGGVGWYLHPGRRRRARLPWAYR